MALNATTDSVEETVSQQGKASIDSGGSCPFLQSYVQDVVGMLAQMNYRGIDRSSVPRQVHMNHVYLETVNHFIQPLHSLGVEVRRLQALIQTMVRVVVYSYPRHSLQVASDLCIYLTYCGILDDYKHNLAEGMQNFATDLINGREQRDAWWQAINKHLSSFLKHYGPFCSLNIFRSTIDFFQGCWIEQCEFQGHPGSHNYPDFLRRLNGLGHCVAATLFPANRFDEPTYLTAIVTIIAEIEQWELHINDLLSFHKEYLGADQQEQANLVANYAHCANTSLQTSLSRILDKVISSQQALATILPNMDADVREVVQDFMAGYVTWHLTDPRYRIHVLVEEAENLRLEGAAELRGFWELARVDGAEEPMQWAVPTLQDMIDGMQDSV